jgi:hypothetical protein
MPIDKNFYDTLTNFGFGAMAAGGQPGATTLGALGYGGMNALQADEQRRLKEAQEKYLAQNMLNKQIENATLLRGINARNRYQGLAPVTLPGVPEELMGSGPIGGAQGGGSRADAIAYGEEWPTTPDEARQALGMEGISEYKAKALTDWLNKNEMTAYQKQRLGIMASRGSGGGGSGGKPKDTGPTTLKNFIGRLSMEYPDMIDPETKYWSDAIDPAMAQRLERSFMKNYRSVKDFEGAYAQTMDEVTGGRGFTMEGEWNPFADNRYSVPGMEDAQQEGAPAYSPEDIAFTAQKHGISEDEVRKRLGISATGGR